MGHPRRALARTARTAGTDCGDWYARAGGDRRRLDRRPYRRLARELLRLRALVPPDQRHERYARRVMEEPRDPSLPRTIGEAAARGRREREAAGGRGEPAGALAPAG